MCSVVKLICGTLTNEQRSAPLLALALGLARVVTLSLTLALAPALTLAVAVALALALGSSEWHETYLVDDSLQPQGETRDKSKWDLADMQDMTFYIVSTENTHLESLPLTPWSVRIEHRRKVCGGGMRASPRAIALRRTPPLSANCVT